MDNLYNLRKLFTAGYREKVLMAGVCRTNGRGIPPSVIQKEEKNTSVADTLRGTTKAARLINCPDCPDLIAASVYDTKPVHLLSMTVESIEWVLKRRKVWSAKDKMMVFIAFLCLEMIDEYNAYMNQTDISDQLRNQYRIDHWLRNRKWWWAILFWGLGVGGTNSYLLYDRSYERERKQHRKGLPKKWTHMDFLVQLVYDRVFPGRIDAYLKQLRESDSCLARSVSSLSSSSVSYDFSTRKKVEKYLKQVDAERITEGKLANSHFARRLDGMFHPSVDALKQNGCQYCFFKWKNEMDEEEQELNKKMEKNRAGVRRCLICNVNLCGACFNDWHGFAMSNTIKLLTGMD